MHSGRKFAIALAVVASLSLMGAAQGQEVVSGPPLFANQYTQGYANQATAQMYIAPVPVPQWVGHTYYTYQPLYPHELMHRHADRYHSYYDNGRGLNRTSVRYSTPLLPAMARGMWNYMSLPRR